MAAEGAAPIVAPIYVEPVYGGLGERVARRAEVGSLMFRRWLGCWVDFIALAVILFAPPFMLGFFGAAVGATDLKAAGGPAVLVGLGLAILYFPFTEGLWGRSLGKLASGTIVVDKAGKRPGFGRAAVRTLLRLVEVNPFLLGGLPAGLVAANTKAHQRIGDLLAGTHVVPLKEFQIAVSKESGADLKSLAKEFS